MILLVLRCLLYAFTLSIYFIYYFGEMSWAMELYFLYGVDIGWYHSVETIAFWFEDVTVQCKAMWCTTLNRWYYSSKAIYWYAFIGIVILQNVTDCFKSLKIFVFEWVFVVKWISLWWIPIRISEINCYRQIDIASTKHIVQEANLYFAFKLNDINFCFLWIKSWLTVF